MVAATQVAMEADDGLVAMAAVVGTVGEAVVVAVDSGVELRLGEVMEAAATIGLMAVIWEAAAVVVVVVRCAETEECRPLAETWPILNKETDLYLMENLLYINASRYGYRLR